MKPLSNDLRERFVDAVLVEGMTCRAAGGAFRGLPFGGDQDRQAVHRDGLPRPAEGRRIAEADSLPMLRHGSRHRRRNAGSDAGADRRCDRRARRPEGRQVQRRQDADASGSEVQKKSLIADEQTRTDVALKGGFFRRFAQRFMDSTRFIFFDETSAKTNMTRLYG